MPRWRPRPQWESWAVFAIGLSNRLFSVLVSSLLCSVQHLSITSLFLASLPAFRPFHEEGALEGLTSPDTIISRREKKQERRGGCEEVVWPWLLYCCCCYCFGALRAIVICKRRGRCYSFKGHLHLTFCILPSEIAVSWWLVCVASSK